MGTMALQGNPYDGHILKDTLMQVEHIGGNPIHIFLDRAFRGHGIRENCSGPCG